jgi:hypothetical protein
MHSFYSFVCVNDGGTSEFILVHRSQPLKLTDHTTMGIPQIKINGYLCLGVALLTIAHLTYTLESSSEALQGNYFTSGIVLSSDGKVLDESVRMRSDDNYLYYFNRLHGARMEFLMRFTSGLFGSARLISDGVAGTLPSEIIPNLDRDIEFNRYYIGNPNSKLSLYHLKIESGCKCYYIPEISLTLCPGSERIRKVN